MKIQYELAKANQTYESFRLVAAEALGGKAPSSSSSSGGEGIQSFAELASAFSEMGGKVGG